MMFNREKPRHPIVVVLSLQEEFRRPVSDVTVTVIRIKIIRIKREIFR